MFFGKSMLVIINCDGNKMLMLLVQIVYMPYVLLPIKVLLISISLNIFRPNKWYFVFESYYTCSERVCLYKNETQYMFSNPRFWLLCAAVNFVFVHVILLAWTMELVFFLVAYSRHFINHSINNTKTMEHSCEPDNMCTTYNSGKFINIPVICNRALTVKPDMCRA